MYEFFVQTSFFYVHVTRQKLLKQHSYEKFARLTLMKLSPCQVYYLHKLWFSLSKKQAQFLQGMRLLIVSVDTSYWVQTSTQLDKKYILCLDQTWPKWGPRAACGAPTYFCGPWNFLSFGNDSVALCINKI